MNDDHPMRGHTTYTAAYVATHWLKAIGIARQENNFTDYRDLLKNVDPGAAPLILSALLPSWFRDVGIGPETPRELPPEWPETDKLGDDDQ